MKEIRKLTTLKNWDKNPRSIKKQDFERLKKQITALGQYKPLLITNDGIVLGGNMRLRAYKELGITDVWVSVVNAPTEEKKLEYALSDNDRAGYYDDDLLANLVPQYPDFEWKDYAVDMKAPQNLSDLVDSFTETVEDEPPAIDDTKEPESKPGEVYQLGRHRLMCGDATSIENVETLMDGQKVDMVLTDPPYGISIVSKNGGVGGGTEGKYRPVIGDDSIQTAIDAYNLCASLHIPKLIFFGGNYFASALPNSPCWLVWDKQDGKQVTFADCELAWTNFTSPTRMFTHVWDGFRRDSEKGVTRVHPTQKPIALLAEILKDYGSEEENVLDLFGGSGSTLIACEQTKRTCYVMELDPKYCDVIRKRYENLTQNKGKQ